MGKWADLGYAKLYAGDFDSALEHFRKGAEENDAESCWGIVELYESCAPKDPAAKADAKSEAAQMLARAAELGHEKAALKLSGVNGKKSQGENQNE